MLRKSVARVLAVMAVAWMTGLGCGGTQETAPMPEQTGSEEQEIGYCGPPSYTCPTTGTTCVRGSCLKQCAPEEPLCGTGQVCCVEYIPPGGPVVMPYCTKYCPSN